MTAATANSVVVPIGLSRAWDTRGGDTRQEHNVFMVGKGQILVVELYRIGEQVSALGALGLVEQEPDRQGPLECRGTLALAAMVCGRDMQISTG